MAGRSLGSLTVDLVLKNGGFEAGMDKSARAAEKSLKRIQSMARGIGTALAGFVSFRAIIAASAEAAKNFAALENAVKNAGEAAGGRTAADFVKLSEQLQSTTTFADDTVQQVEQLLLSFQSIRTDRFEDATKAVLDLSVGMKIDAVSAAKLLGRALSDPEKGMTALARAGVVLSEAQKKIIKDLADTGKRAEAQGILLDALKEKFGGAAEAARNNFGGALEGVKNAFDNLLEIDGGLPGATKALNELAAIFEDPGVKAGADALFSGIVVAAAKTAQLIGEIAAGIQLIASRGTGGNNDQVNLDSQIRNLEEERDRLSQAADGAFGVKGMQLFGESTDDAKKKLIEVNKQIADLTFQLEQIQGLGSGGLTPLGKSPVGSSELPKNMLADPEADTEELTKKQEALQKQLEASGKALTDSLATPLQKYSEAVKQADKLLAAHVITQETYAKAVTAAGEAILGPEFTAQEAFRKAVADADTQLAAHLITQDQYAIKVDAARAALNAWTPAQAEYDAAVKTADDLLAANVITLEEWANALGKARGELEGISGKVAENFGDTDSIIAEFDASLEGANAESQDLFDTWAEADLGASLDGFDKVLEKSVDKSTDLFKHVAENAQDILGDGIYNAIKSGFDDGIEGALDAFADMLLRLATEAVAAQITQKIFGDPDSAGGGGGWLSALGSGISALFSGGSKDSGGHGNPGVAYAIGTGAQPETFVPDSHGEFFPAGSMGGGMTVIQNFNIQAPNGSMTRQTQMQIGAAAAKGIGNANRRNN